MVRPLLEKLTLELVPTANASLETALEMVREIIQDTRRSVPGNMNLDFCENQSDKQSEKKVELVEKGLKPQCLLSFPLQSLPEDKHKHIIDQFIATPDGPQKAENIIGAYYTPEQMRGALKKGQKKQLPSLLLNRIKSGSPRTSATAFSP